MEKERFPRRVPLLNMSLTEHDDACAARWLGRSLPGEGECYHRRTLHRYLSHHWRAPWVASFMGGRGALFAIMRSLDLLPGDQIIIPAFTCQCVTNAITFNGVGLVYADIEPQTYGLDIAAVERVKTPRTRAILIQYSFGLVCRDLEPLLDLARRNGWWIIEDCAHGTGARWQGQRLGTLGHIAFFSSERSKMVNTIHGGWALTANPELGARLMAVYGRAPEPDNGFILRLLHTLRRARAEIAGRHYRLPVEPVPQMQAAELAGQVTAQYGWRMAEPVAELLLLQLAQLDRILARRRRGARYWDRWLREQGMAPLPDMAGAEHSWLRYPLWVDPATKARREVLEQRLNIEAGVWFTSPMHPQPCALDHCPTGMAAAASCLNLPTWLWEADDPQ